ncbi:N-acetylornithine carbamoyltransferase [Carboxylicivirga marina]|uniref:N-succinylornithine carbamoyltransferase n=1 Tax=Carboxylicivirga marina TaxID=2800988 RepID=A0ABS1HIG5_9BACT|nr:N-acetylornithine carbamoyltransferase [Carboxylicivirga marina]MBK3517464.1 N-acetylornithine carbamoyltransferase [Carboxylicivirga marina]
MKRFLTVNDIGDLDVALKEAAEVKKNPYAFDALGKNKTIILIFFNSSLRTRLSTQKAAMNLGMNVIVLDVNKDGWKLETEFGVIMDGDKPEHLREAVPVIGRYCDIIAVRSFASFEDKKADYEEQILSQFIEFAGVPVISMESATRHPLQAFADLFTIEEHKNKERPKVVLTWAPHPRALPQAVPNSFVEWMKEANVDLVVTHPEGYELAPEFSDGVTVEYNQKKAFENADFIYAKNWASYSDYGQILSQDKSWTVDEEKMDLTNNARFMHCLPVRRNMIVSDAVIDSENSIVIDEAANRVVSAQLVIKRMLESLK